MKKTLPLLIILVLFLVSCNFTPSDTSNVNNTSDFSKNSESTSVPSSRTQTENTSENSTNTSSSSSNTPASSKTTSGKIWDDGEDWGPLHT